MIYYHYYNNNYDNNNNNLQYSHIDVKEIINKYYKIEVRLKFSLGKNLFQPKQKGNDSDYYI